MYKINVYRAIHRPILNNGCKRWTMTKQHKSTIQSVEMCIQYLSYVRKENKKDRVKYSECVFKFYFYTCHKYNLIRSIAIEKPQFQCSFSLFATSVCFKEKHVTITRIHCLQIFAENNWNCCHIKIQIYIMCLYIQNYKVTKSSSVVTLAYSVETNCYLFTVIM